MNIAQRCKSYYDSSDFKASYYACLYEQFGNDEKQIVERIQTLFNVSNYETNGYFEWNYVLTYADAKRVYDFIYENFERFVKDFSGYYVGSTSLDSVAFGEYEEQLDGVYNSKTQGVYGLKYMRKVFTAEGYYVKNNFAYYSLGGGLHVELLNCKDDINELLKNV